MNVFVYLTSLTGIILLPFWWAKVLCVLVNGISIGTLFVVGHDACHGSLTARSKLNKIFGRICFLPSLTPFETWRHGHNFIHHGYTNLRAKDYVWRPLSLEEFRSLPWWKRLLQRSYKTTPGVAINWIFDIWLPHLVFPSKDERKAMKRWWMVEFDRACVLLYLCVKIAALFGLNALAGWIGVDPLPVWALLTFGFVVPFLIWCWLVGFVILVQHTNPGTRWYQDEEEWNYWAGQIKSTHHILLMPPVPTILHNIMEHTAHHVDPTIPLYRLPEQQKLLEQLYEDDVIVEKFSLRFFWRILSDCRLYDYEENRWLKFDGTPTTDSLT